MRAGLVVAVVLAGCRFDGGLGAGLLCPTGECPDGQVCAAGVCELEGGGADAATSAPDGGDGQDGAVTPDAAAGDNLVSNPGMEDGIDPWTPFNGFLATTDVELGGAASLKVCAETGDKFFTVYQDVVKSPPSEILAGTRYVASVWVRSAPASAAPSSMNLMIRESGGAAPRTDHEGPTVAGPDETWIKLEASGTVQEADRDNVILLVWGLDTSGSACFLVDDARMVVD